MPVQDSILAIIRKRPGTHKHTLCDVFHLTRYRLHRVFRHIARELQGQTLIHDDEHGVWILDMDPGKCSGTDWVGADKGGHRQCVREPEFPDGCCYLHSHWENPEMIAFERRLHCLTGPRDPSAERLSELSLPILEELRNELWTISPRTLRDHEAKLAFLRMLTAATARRRYKDELRRRHEEPQMPPEFARRHRMSSGSPFEFVLRKHFECLELPCTATKEQVLQAWRRLARLHHPDMADGSEEIMKTINLAKEKIFSIRCWNRPKRRSKTE
ncbi:MAG: J domain-containing protein [Thermodesulfobacteriota bacterium]